MKTIAMITFALITSAASALTYKTTNVPTMLMENGFEFESVKVTNICQQADGSFKTIDKVKNKCVKYSRNFRSAQDYRNADNGCLRTGAIHLFAAETVKKGYCAEWGREDGEYGCIRIAYNTVTRPLDYVIQEVIIDTRGGDDRETRVIKKVLSSEDYTIPACN
ncbi:hypothetical protein [Bacteriovorax sp. Seq25_V]|uniref:hypothetical protein n=1 Tax=Bacteriovorax sp. Seq25_V TaxID=1201288 RepID=UPI00038A19A3|nr:hypothetical protein [Bacteriovorax sp. Seq25_V]EQC45678.1 hypothetical protein M900_2255 [Bacteriovorax sp. Seq25_V]